ncbi:MAG: esterase family protein [Acidimicrobiales bacterium]|nr:esterase family protein [Acidimicrobiales bacterium]
MQRERLADLLDGLEAAGDLGPDSLAPLRSHPDLGAADGQDAVRAAALLSRQGFPADLQTAAQLALRAHQSGVPGAGRVCAEAVDRAAVMSSRTQRFGTFAYEYKGELLLAPLDGTVSDELRAEFGVGSIEELRREVEAANRAAAAARTDGGPPDHSQGYVRIWRDPTEEELRARWAAEGQPIWADGDELTVVCDRPLIGAIVGPLFELPMWRVGSLLVLTVRVHRLDEAVFTYGFWPLDEDGRPAFSVRPDPDGRFRGVNARPAAPTNDTIVGRVEEHELPSESLGRPRKVSVYLPAGFDPAENLPVVYSADGQFFAPYTRRVDAAIEAGTAPRCVIVAPHAGRNRTGEYFPGYDPGAYAAHAGFFLDEVPAWAERTYNVATERARRAVCGASDGGAHALSIAVRHPERFGHVIAYSSGMPPNGNERWASGEAPYIQLCAGVYEGQFHLSTYSWHAFLEMTGVEHHWVERVCAHELIQWIEELPDAIARAFGGSAH